MAQEATRLQLLDVDTGAVTDLSPESCPNCEVQRQVFEEQIRGLEKDLRSYRRRLERAQADRDRDLWNSPLYPQAEALHELHRVTTGRNRKMDAKDLTNIFGCIRAIGFWRCLYAVAGARYDPYTSVRRNSSVQVHDTLGLVIRSAEKAESFAAKAPLDFRPDPFRISEITDSPLRDVLEWIEPETQRRAQEDRGRGRS